MTELNILLCAISLALLPVLALWMLRRTLCRILLADSRFSRILHFLLMAVFGASVQVESYRAFAQPSLILRFVCFFFLLFYAGQFAVISNNIEDLEADRLTNTQRPLVKGQIAQTPYLRIGLFCLLFSLCLAALAGLTELLTIAAISFVYYTYSVRPFKLKRFVILAKFLIGLNSLFAAMYGFVISGGGVQQFPVAWAVFILVPISLMANFVDLKDTAGDRLAGVNTLPVLLGERQAKIIIALSAVFTYFYAAWMLGNVYLGLLILLLCIFHLFLLFRVPYSEKPLFVLHNSLFLGLIVLILILK